MNDASTFRNAGWSEENWDFSTGAAPDVKVVDIDANPTAGYIEIHTADDLKKMTAYNAYVLMADIDLSGTNWTPLCHNENFAGILDGNGHKITGLTINNNSLNEIGFFESTSGAVIRNIEFENVNITTNNATYVGVVSGYDVDSVFENIKVTNATINTVDAYTGSVTGYSSRGVVFSGI